MGNWSYMNRALEEKQPLTWRAWASVAWDSVGVVGLCFEFITVKLQGPNIQITP